MYSVERVNSQCREDQQSMYSVERVNSQCREDQQSMYSVERVNSQCREGQQSMWRGSTVNFHFCVKRQSPLLIPGGQINDQHREDQQ